MIYLLSQMILALLMAAILGGALGWLLHRSTQVREGNQLRGVIQRQRQQVAQLNSEIAMLTDDYDELQRQTHDELAELREANQQIPRLNSNLEKSQLLVSQMLKRNESQVRDLTSQNQTLTQKLKEFEAREQQLKRQQADQDSARRELGVAEPVTATSATDETTGDDSEESNELQDTSVVEAVEADAADADTTDESGSTEPAEPDAEAAVEASSGEQAELDSDEEAANSAEVAVAETEADSDEEAESVVATDTDVDADSAVEASSDEETAPAAETGSDANDESAAENPRSPTPIITNTRNVSSWASAPIVAQAANVVSAPEKAGKKESAASSKSEKNKSAASAKAVKDEASASTSAKTEKNEAPATSGKDETVAKTAGNETSAATASEKAAVPADARGNESKTAKTASESDDEPTDIIDIPALGGSGAIFLNADAPLGDSDADSSKSADSTAGNDDEFDPFDQVIEIDDQLMKDIDSEAVEDEFLNSLDQDLANDKASEEDASPFEPVEQHDDLQRIGGIGPSTEKALNEMGITSYAQLAMLKHQEIETIANALQIVPDRIESDDWVGNARRQLEDVLEQL